MNILFLLRLWPVYGGGETVTIRLANGMARMGWTVSVAYFKDSAKEAPSLIDDKVRTYRIDGVDCDEFHADASCGDCVQDAAVKLINKMTRVRHKKFMQ